jgi:aminoglycoside N3'-acetyltransferase
MHRNSPIGLLEQADGYCLMVGCYTAVTFRHIVETSLKTLCCGQRSEEYPAILPDGTRTKLRAWAWMNGSCRAIRHQEIYSWLQKHGKIKELVLGNSHLRLFKLADYRTAYERLLKGKNGCAGCEIRPRQNSFSVDSDWDLQNDCLKSVSTAFTGEIDWEKLNK